MREVLIVVLDENLRAEEERGIIEAIRAMKGVARVTTIENVAQFVGATGE